MSRDNSEKKRLSREARKKTAVRIIAIILAVLMVLGLGVTAITVIFGSKIWAEEPVEVIDTSSLKQSGDVLITAGLYYGSDVPSSFECASDEGFLLGIQELDGERDFTELWILNETTVTCASDCNLTASARSFTPARTEREADIGAYHLEVNFYGYDRDELEEIIEDNAWYASRLGYDLIPAYIHGNYVVRIGSFFSWNEADDAIERAEDIFPDRRISVVSPTGTGVTVLDPYERRILFEFDCDGMLELGVTAREDRNGNTYVKTTSGYIYDGVFTFKRTVSGTTDGLTVINVIPLEAYVAGVLPYETSNSWPIETMKAFAMTVRSFTLTHCRERGKHKNQGFDLCCEVCCQVYRGAGRTNDAVMDAVLGTAGKVITYRGDIVTAYYSSSVGGVTVNVEDAWEGSDPVPYLKAVETPWENYMEHENSFWINEISPTALLERLRKAGYNQLQGAVENVEVLALAQNSTYVKTLRVTDIYGNSVTINTTDAVRTSLTPYVKSANFVIGKGKVEYTEDIVMDYIPPQTSTDDLPAEPQGPLGIEYSYTDLDSYVVISSDSLERSYFSNSVLLVSGEGYTDYFRKDIFAITSENAAAFLGEEYDELYGNGEERTSVRIEENDSADRDSSGRRDGSGTVYKIAYAEDSDNFIFVGKGWGHGVGMSQWGALDLAARGYTAKEILDAYFTDVDIMDYLDTNQY